MVGTAIFAAFVLTGQTQKPSLEDNIKALAADLRQSLTLLDSLKAKVNKPEDAAKLLTQFNDKMETIGEKAQIYIELAKTDDEKAQISIIRFEALANGQRPPEQIEGIASDILAKYKDCTALCPAIEDLTFYQYLTPDRYSTFDTMVKQSKNDEVLASAQLASIFIQFLNEEGDINKFRQLATKYKATKAGIRAAHIFELRTKVILGEPMVDVDLDLLSGTKVTLNSLKGKIVVLDFWGFWCPPAVNDLSTIKEYVSKNPTRLTWIGINTDNWTTSFVSQRIKESGITWPNVAAGSPSGRIPLDFGIVTYPAKFIIDPFGIVRYVPSSRDWRQVLDELLSKS